jgi:flagella basal body P-ring formation protein FlgA
MPTVIFFLGFGSHTVSMQALLLIFGLLTLNIGHAGGFSGGHDALVSETTDWIAADQLLDHTQIEVIPPDKRVPVESCQTRLSIRFPFANNLKTVEVVCKNPAWKRYLRVKIREQQNAWVFTENLTEGTQIKEEHLAYLPKASSEATEPLKKDQIIGRVIRQNVSDGEVVIPDLLGNEIVVYVPSRSYEAGETIQLADLVIERRIENSLDKVVTVWPQQTVIAKTLLNPGVPILKNHIEIVELVLIAKTTIVNGQVLTEDMVESRPEAINAYGPKGLTKVEEIIGLEATRTIRAGQKLNVSDFIAADLVRKNETVRLVIRRGALEITVETIAMENGKIGEQVLLRNPDSGKEIRGIVTGRHEARGL